MKISKKDKAEIDTIELRQKALYGRPYGSADMFVAQILEAFHAGRYPKTKLWAIDPNDSEAFAVSLPWALNHFISQAIILNEPQVIHDLANAVTRVHGDAKRPRRRTRGHGPNFEIEAHDPALLHALDTTAGGTLPVSKALLKRSVFENTGVRIGDKKAQRILRMIGAPPDKGGRPKGQKLPTQKPRLARQPNLSELKVDIAEAKDAFFKSRGISPKHHK